MAWWFLGIKKWVDTQCLIAFFIKKHRMGLYANANNTLTNNMDRSSFLKKLIASLVIGKLPLEVTKQFRKIYLLQCFVAGFS